MGLAIRRPSRPAPHSPLLLEQLEDRNLLSGNLLITAEVPGSPSYNLMQYTQSGSMVSSQSIPPAPGSTETPDARGLSVDPSGNVNVFDGTQQPALATLSATTQNWSFQSAAGWGTAPNITYGEVTSYHNFMFASNMGSSNGQSYGIVRFDSAADPPVFFAPGSSFVQITLGQDGLLYGLENSGTGPTISQTVQVFNPDTLSLVRTFTLSSTQPEDIRSIAVDGARNVYAAAWGGTVAAYDPNGNPTGASIQLKVPPFSFNENLIDIALDTDGQVAVGGRRGEIYLTNESLSSVQVIQTHQANVFVAFDHYTGPTTVTPTFSALAGPTITYGQPSVTLGGTIATPSTIPPGNVNITVDGVTEAAAINQSNGSFSAVFDTSAMGVSGSPYTITYNYAAQGNYNAVTDTSKSLTVLQAVTSLNNLSSPTVVIGTPTVTLTGTVGSDSPALPAGQDVTVTLIEANGTMLATTSGVIASDGSFKATISTDALPVGAYTIQYKYAGDTNFTASSGTGTLQVTYAVNPLYDTTKPVHAGAALPVKLDVTDAAGDNLSSAELTVTAISIVGPNGQTYTPQAKGNANPNNVFRYVSYGYLYNLDTTGLAPGKYTLFVKVGDDPVLHGVSFVVD